MECPLRRLTTEGLVPLLEESMFGSRVLWFKQWLNLLNSKGGTSLKEMGHWGLPERFTLSRASSSFCFSELCSTSPPAEITTVLWSSTTGSTNHGVRLLSWEPASVFPPSSCFGWGVSTQWLKLTHLAKSGPLTESAHKIHMKDPLRFLFSLTWMSRTL